MKPLKVLGLSLSGLFVGSVILLVLFFGNASQGTIEFEVAKALLEIGIVSVTGAVVTALVFEYQHRRREDENERDLYRMQLEYRDKLLLSTLTQAMNAYSQAKRARRLLRGKAIVIQDEDKEEIVLADQYDTYLETINAAQLELENLARDVETSTKAFSHSDTLKDHLWKMESYLHKLVGEYEESRRYFSDGKLSFDKLPNLKEFLLPAKDSSFKPQFVAPYHEVQRFIRKDLLHPNIPERSTTPGQSQQPTAYRSTAQDV